MTERHTYIDIAKGIGIIAVVIGHTCDPAGDLAKAVYHFHLPLFFILSGLTADTSRPLQSVFYRRGRSLLLPYISTVLVSYIYWLLIYRPLANDPNDPLLIGELILRSSLFATGQLLPAWPEARPIGPLWFLPALFVGQLMFSAITRLRSVTHIWMACILVSSVGILLGQGLRMPWSVDIAMAAQVFFAFGRFVLPELTDSLTKPTTTILCLCSVIIAFLGSDLSINDRVYRNFFIACLGACAGTLLVLQLSRFIEKWSLARASLSYVGRASIIILCFHTFDTTWGHLNVLLPNYRDWLGHWTVLAGLRLSACLIIFELLSRFPIRALFSIPHANYEIKSVDNRSDSARPI